MPSALLMAWALLIPSALTGCGDVASPEVTEQAPPQVAVPAAVSAQPEGAAEDEANVVGATSPARLLELAQRVSDSSPTAPDADPIWITDALAQRWPAVFAALEAEPSRIDRPGRYGRTLLMLAASAPGPAPLARLLELGADPNQRDASGNTPLFFLIDLDRAAGIAPLLAAGAELEARNASGATPLLAAARVGRLAMVEALLAAGAKRDGVDRRGRSALAAALSGGHLAVAERLRDPDVPLRDQLGPALSEVLRAAAMRGDVATSIWITSRLGAGTDCEPAARDALFAAIAADQLPATRSLLSALPGCATSCDRDGLTPLQRSAAEGKTEFCGALVTPETLESTGCDSYERTPLLLAAQNGHADSVERLLKSGASPAARTESGVTALMYAAQRGEERLLEQLLEVGADIAAENRDGNTALLFGVVYRRRAVVETLLARGAAPDGRYRIEAFGKMTPLGLAAGRGHADIADSLIRAGAQLDTPSDVDDLGRMTPLLLAARRGSTQLVEQLLQAGANPEIRSRDGLSYVELLERGRARGADSRAEDTASP